MPNNPAGVPREIAIPSGSRREGCGEDSGRGGCINESPCFCQREGIGPWKGADERTPDTAPARLPAVAGSVLPCSIVEFERRCLVWLMREQEKIAPDNSLIALICDAVRLSREHAGMLRQSIEERNGK